MPDTIARGRQQMISQIDVSLVHPELRKRITASVTLPQFQKNQEEDEDIGTARRTVQDCDDCQAIVSQGLLQLFLGGNSIIPTTL